MQCRAFFPVLAALGTATFPALAAQAAPTVSIRSFPPSTASYKVAEVDLVVNAGGSEYSNPFDPEVVSVDAVVTAPDGTRRTVPGFWNVPYTWKDGGMKPTGAKGSFRVRFAPDTPGKWRVAVTVRDATGSRTTSPVTVLVTAAKPASHGFLKNVSGSRYFAFSDNTPAFLVGENVCWGGQRGLADFQDWFPALGKAGGNFARLWMAFSPIESKETGLTKYDSANATYWDEVLRLAQQNGLHCMLAFGTYGEFTSGGFFNEGRWGINPYNAANGGPVPTDKPEVFFTDPAARKAYRNRLRYLVARYSAFTSLGMWEFWNEKSVPAAWYKEMAGEIAKIDPYRHPITNSYSTVGDKGTLSLPRMDVTQTHRYGDEGSVLDITPVIVGDAQLHWSYAKPHLMGEFGISWRGSDEKFDPKGTGTNLHNGLWSSTMVGNAGSAMIWWWDSYVHPKNLYHEFTPLAKFTRNIAWTKRRFAPLELPAIQVSRRAPETFTDFAFTTNGSWGDRANKPVPIGRDTKIGPGIILSHLYGPEKPEMRSVQTFIIDNVRPCKLIVHVGTVSNRAQLRVTVNGKEAVNVPLDASPSGPGGYASTKQYTEYGGIYQAVFNKDIPVDLPAGKATVTLENTTGDWIQMGTYVLQNFRSSRFASLRTLALQDATSGETLIWLQDPESNWKNDRDNKIPASWDGIKLTVPLPKPTRVRVEWWDTRTGTIILQTKPAPAKKIILSPPVFRRDIACRLIPLP